MQRFLVRRFFIVIVTLFAVSVIIFVLARAGGDPRSMLLDDYTSEQQWEDLGKSLGVDKPYYHQYAIFIADVFRGDFGQSISQRRPVIAVISKQIWATFQLGLAAFLFSVVIGIPLGVLSSVRRGGILDFTGKVVALIGQSAPSFWLGGSWNSPCCSPLQKSRAGSTFAGWRSWCTASRGLGSAEKKMLSRCVLPVVIPRAPPLDSWMEWRRSCAASPPRVRWYETPWLAEEASACWQPSEAAAPSSAQTRTSGAFTGFWSSWLAM